MSAFEHGGDIAGHIRAHDGTLADLGPPEAWPPTLRTVVDTMLASSQSMFVVWGAARTWLYNNAFADIVGPDHPEAFGGSFEEVGPRLFPELVSVVERGLAGEPSRMEDNHVVLQARGQPNNAYQSVSCTPLRNDDGEVAGVLGILKDTTARQRAADKLRRAHSLIEGITRGTEDMIAAEDRDFRYLYFNEAYSREFEKLWGQQIKVGTSMIEAMAPWPEEQRKAKKLWSRALDGESFTTTMEFGPSEDEMRVYELRFNPIYDEEDRLLGAAHIFRDVTERVRMEEALRESKDRLHEADRRKDEYLAMLGHELRNPLAAVQSATDVVKMAAHDDDPRLVNAARVLERQSDHMAGIIDGLLEVSRIARGKISLSQETLDLRELLQELLNDQSSQVEARDLQIGASISNTPVWVTGDPVRLTQIFGNLMSNAIKFTEPPGRILVEVFEDDDEAVVRVTDTGVGIRSELLPSIFEAFRQEAQDFARSAGGLGLGLALAKNLAELHGGTISAYSPGRGSGAEFVVRLPLVEAPAVEDSAARPQEAGSRCILVVEDNPDAAQMLQDLLELKGHRVTVAHRVSEALEELSSQDFDVVFCDLGLPGASGYELARSVQKDASLDGLELIALTGYGQPEDRRRSAEAGFDEHLTKPVDLKALQRVLDALD
ncbi:response regulator [Persicimonas caeni]|uniref:histidine kinase n=1 Tax=Persicimonas caeni TaxID=2292766 RepID=A0A4Y6PWI0_PERCE|nr:PAS domain-containing protein [Persicimonas caeni]QDG52666.1 response regulator [Persicimonas caeni]QED33888.1 response regulator [Persicimonas caeni]